MYEVRDRYGILFRKPLARNPRNFRGNANGTHVCANKSENKTS